MGSRGTTVELLRQWNAGDERALGPILERNLEWIQNRVRQRLGPGLRQRAESSDFVQESLVHFLRYGPRLEIGSKAHFRRLMARIVENTLRDQHDWFHARRRAISREQPLPPDTVLTLDARPDSLAGQHEAEACVRLAVELLAPKERLVIVLRQWEGLSFEAIGQRLGISADGARKRFDRALPVLAQKIDEVRRGVLFDGESAPAAASDAAGPLCRLALHYRQSGRLEEAELLLRRALATGAEHARDVLDARAQLARLHVDQGRHEEAEALLTAALAERLRLLGEGDADTLASLHELGRYYRRCGRHAEAAPLLERALAGRVAVLGAEHADTLAARDSLASLLRATGQLEAAEREAGAALAGRRIALGEEHPATLGSLANLGRVLRARGQLAAARAHLEQALIGTRRTLGPAHPDALACAANLALVCEDAGDDERALELLREAGAACARELETGHPQALLALRNLALFLHARGRHAEALAPATELAGRAPADADAQQLCARIARAARD